MLLMITQIIKTDYTGKSFNLCNLNKSVESRIIPWIMREDYTRRPRC